jgi:DNA-binding transcriptional MerR regulator
MPIQMLTSSQVARKLELSVERVRQLARAGVLPPDEVTELGRLWRAETVERFAADRGRLGRFQGSEDR